MNTKIYLKNLNDQAINDYANTVSFFDAFECHSGIEQTWVYGPWQGKVRSTINQYIRDHVKRHGTFPTEAHDIFLEGKLHGRADSSRQVLVRFPNICPNYKIVDGELIFDRVWDIRCDASLGAIPAYFQGDFPKQILRNRPFGVPSRIRDTIEKGRSKFLFDLGHYLNLPDNEYALLTKLALLILDLNQFPPNGHHILNLLMAIETPNNLEINLILRLIHQYEKDNNLPYLSISTPYFEAHPIRAKGNREDNFYHNLISLGSLGEPAYGLGCAVENDTKGDYF